MGQNWRWRVLTADVLPACSERDAIIAPSQASQLSGAAEIRMWSAADAQQQPRANATEAEGEPGSSARHGGGYHCSLPTLCHGILHMNHLSLAGVS